jgi:damage-control phosphatase, subfamily III
VLRHLSARSYETVVKRWPVILTGVIDSVYSVNHELTNFPDKAAKLEEGKTLIATLSRLKYGMARDRALEYVVWPSTAYSQRYLRETS